MKFSGVITMVKSDVHAKGQGQRSKVKVTEVNTQLSRFRTLTPVWIHIWQWNDAYSLMMLRRGALSFLKVIHQISRSHGSKKRWIWPRLIIIKKKCNEDMIIMINYGVTTRICVGKHVLKSVEFDPDWAFPDCNSSLNSPMAMKCCTKLEVE